MYERILRILPRLIIIHSASSKISIVSLGKFLFVLLFCYTDNSVLHLKFRRFKLSSLN